MKKMKKTEIFDLTELNSTEVRYIANALLSGKTAVLPTDTVYGIVTTAKPEFLRILNEAKNNASDKPAQILCSKSQALVLAQDGVGLKAALNIWPGALTAILSGTEQGKALSGLDTVGLRVPAGKLTQDLFDITGLPLYASSANMHTLPTLESVEEVLDIFTGNADIIIKGGFLKAGPSAVIDFTVCPPKIIRRGSLKNSDVEILLSCGG